MRDKTFIVVVGIFLISGVISWSLYFKKYGQKDTINIHEFPKTIGSWQSEELPISDKDYEVLETRNAFVRRYFNGKDPDIFLFIVYSQNNRKVSHPPEVCYAGSGVTILEHQTATLALSESMLNLDVNKLVLSKGNAKQVAYYWFKVGDSFTASYWKQQILIALKTLMGKSSSSALIRVAVDVNGDEASSIQHLQEFSRHLVPQIQRYLL